MSEEVTLYQRCPQCLGEGTFTPSSGPGAVGPIPCTWPECGGSGYIPMGKCTLDPSLADILDRVNDVLDKCSDILEAVQVE